MMGPNPFYLYTPTTVIVHGAHASLHISKHHDGLSISIQVKPHIQSDPDWEVTLSKSDAKTLSTLLGQAGE